MPRKIAYCDVPKSGGTFNFYRNLKKALQPLGWRVFAVSAGLVEAKAWDPTFEIEDCVCIASEEINPHKIAQELAAWVEREKIDIFIPMSSSIGSSTVPHLPPLVRVVSRCSSISRHAYDVVCNNASFVSRVVATSKRQYDDLKIKRKLPEQKLAFVTHGFDTERFATVSSLRNQVADLMRLVYIGRLEHLDKGCLYLAELVKILGRQNIPFTLDIVGDGPDGDELRSRIGRLPSAGRVTFHGNRPNREIPLFLSRVDVFLMPSHFEGFGFSLVEAMVAGCVPVASCIRGVTDWIVTHGRSGFVCDISNMRQFAEAVGQLHQDRGLLRQMSVAAATDAQTRFNLDRMGCDYNRVFREVLAEPLATNRPRPWEEFRLDPAYATTWRRFVPQPLKNLARRWGLAG